MNINERLDGESGKEPEEPKTKRPVWDIPDGERPVPLFLRDSSDGHKGDAQDEKDGTVE